MLTVADATTAMRTEWLQSSRALESLAGRSAACHCLAPFDPQPALPSTTVRPSQSYGWRTSGWHASWEELEETIELSSDSSNFSSLTPLAGGSRNSRPTKFMTGPTWLECSREISREPTSAPATRGISASVSRKLENLSDSTPDASPSNAQSSHTSPTMMSSWHLCRAPPTRTWCGSWDAIARRPSMS